MRRAAPSVAKSGVGLDAVVRRTLYYRPIITYGFAAEADLNDPNTIDTISSQAQVFRASKGWRLFFFLATPPLTIAFLAVAVMPFVNGKPMPLVADLLCIFFGLGFAVLIAYSLYEILVCRFELYPDRIRDVTPLRTRTLLLKDIQGFRIFSSQGNRTLILVPRDPKANKPIKTALLFERQDALFAWLNLHLTDLNIEERKKETTALLQDPRLGQTADERESRLRQATRWARLVNGIGVAATLWALFYPQPYALAIGATCLTPWTALAAVLLSGNLIRLDGKVNSAYPNVGFAFLMPCPALMLRAFTDYHILSWQAFWPLFFLVSLAFAGATVGVEKELRKRAIHVLPIILFAALYGYASVLCLNAVLDRSTPTVYKTEVLKKWISSGQHATHTFLLAPWGARTEPEKFDVGRRVYNRHKVGDTADVVVRKGRFGIPWSYVR